MITQRNLADLAHNLRGHVGARSSGWMLRDGETANREVPLVDGLAWLLKDPDPHGHLMPYREALRRCLAPDVTARRPYVFREATTGESNTGRGFVDLVVRDRQHRYCIEVKNRSRVRPGQLEKYTAHFEDPRSPVLKNHYILLQRTSADPQQVTVGNATVEWHTVTWASVREALKDPILQATLTGKPLPPSVLELFHALEALADPRSLLAATLPHLGEIDEVVKLHEAARQWLQALAQNNTCHTCGTPCAALQVAEPVLGFQEDDEFWPFVEEDDDPQSSGDPWHTYDGPSGPRYWLDVPVGATGTTAPAYLLALRETLAVAGHEVDLSAPRPIPDLLVWGAEACIDASVVVEARRRLAIPLAEERHSWAKRWADKHSTATSGTTLLPDAGGELYFNGEKHMTTGVYRADSWTGVLLLTPAHEGSDKPTYAAVLVDLADSEAGIFSLGAADGLPFREGNARTKLHLALDTVLLTAENAASEQGLEEVLDGLLDRLRALRLNS